MRENHTNICVIKKNCRTDLVGYIIVFVFRRADGYLATSGHFFDLSTFLPEGKKNIWSNFRNCIFMCLM